MSNNLDASTPKVFVESTWLQGSIVTIFLYGIVVCLSVICWRSLWPRTRLHNPGYKKCRFFFGCVTFLFVLATIFAAFVAETSEKVFIQNRLFPGGMSEL
jgi:glucan phosphoethanolaminetransferase (alkaline phosphatase superfamily)